MFDDDYDGQGDSGDSGDSVGGSLPATDLDHHTAGLNLEAVESRPEPAPSETKDD